MTRLRFLATTILALLGSLLHWCRSAGQFRAKFASASKPVHPEIGYAMTQYTLMRRGNQWQWRTSGGREMSPVFDSVEKAAAFHPNMGHTVRALVVERVT